MDSVVRISAGVAQLSASDGRNRMQFEGMGHCMSAAAVERYDR
jgi:hypothetical protein